MAGIAAGTYHTVALKADGSLVSWGYNGDGRGDTHAEIGDFNILAAGADHTVAVSTNSLPVRAVSSDGAMSALHVSVSMALTTPPDWTIEVTPIATGGFVAYNRAIHGLQELSIPGVVHLYYGARVVTEGTLFIGSAGNDATSYFQSNATDASEPAIEFGILASAGTRTISNAPVRVLGAVDLRMASGSADLSATHRIILEGGVFSSNPDGTSSPADSVSARFVSCSSPEHATVTPCLVFGMESVIDLPPLNKLISNGPTTTLIDGNATLRSGSSIETDADLAIGGSMRLPVGTAVTLSVDRVTVADPAFSILAGGELAIESGSSMQIAAPAKTALAGSLTVDQNGLFSLLGGTDILQVEPFGDVRCFGGAIRADELTILGSLSGSPDPVGRLVGVDALIDVDRVVVRGGSAILANSAIVGDLFTETLSSGGTEAATVAVSGQCFGDLMNADGRVIAIGDFVVVGDVANEQGSQILAQVGVLYITGSLVNNGVIFGNVISAPNFNGGGSGGTQVGDGIRVEGAVEVGPAGGLRFVEDVWKVSVCGDMALACASDQVRFDDAKLSLNGCDGSVQSLEATSLDVGCVESAFSGEETDVSLIGELEIMAGATVSLVDAFNNAPGKAPEVVYARRLIVQPGAMLLTNDITIVTQEAMIDGTIDDRASVCVVVEAPDPDINGDGHVNGIDLAFVLTYWGASGTVADLDNDGLVGGADLAILLSGWTG